jgi:Ca-activated chloride channel homolog
MATLDQANPTSDREPAATVSLGCLPERHLIREGGGSVRHIVFTVTTARTPEPSRQERPPVTIALVLDRSGSMAGGKLPTAKRAALAVLDRLDDRDQVAAVVFDHQIDELQPLAPATAATKERIRRALEGIEPRGNTALHEGWLVGCKAIAPDSSERRGGGVARCFLLTDGQANHGLTDPEQIATQVAGVRDNAGIGTSTFGIGSDYNESLLGPMAVAGGGQFHHLRTPEDIVSTFVGELGEMLSVAASKVRLELDGGSDITTELISSYWASQPLPGVSRVGVSIGDLPAGQERQVVVRFRFPARDELGERTILARLLWSEDGREQSTPWQEVRFAYADHGACDGELHHGRNRAAMRWVGLHHAERAKRMATELNRQGDYHGARQWLQGAARHIGEYAGRDPALQAAIGELQGLIGELGVHAAAPEVRKEMYFQSQRLSRGQQDYRGGPDGSARPGGTK